MAIKGCLEVTQFFELLHPNRLVEPTLSCCIFKKVQADTDLASYPALN
jgi:hypothetical protein